MRRRLILVAEGIQELGKDQMRNRCNRSPNIPKFLILPRVLLRVGRTPVDKLTALNRNGVNIFLSIRDGNAAKNHRITE